MPEKTITSLEAWEMHLELQEAISQYHTRQKLSPSKAQELALRYASSTILLAELTGDQNILNLATIWEIGISDSVTGNWTLLSELLLADADVVREMSPDQTPENRENLASAIEALSKCLLHDIQVN